LARELHDGIGQVMGYASLQLDVVQGCIAGGHAALCAGDEADALARLDKAESHVARLSSVVDEAHADMREQILNLRLAPSDQRPFFVTLRHYLDGFSQNYGIQTELAVGAGGDAGKLNASSQMQLFRIIQEALSNARKHAAASCVHLSFDAGDGRLTVRIEDNGGGFDPARAARDGEGHFGLRIMAERAEGMGGTLRGRSESGAGTCVVIELPIAGSGGEEGR